MINSLNTYICIWVEDDQCFTIFVLDEEYQTDQVTLEIASVNIRSLTSDSGLVQQVRKKLYWMWIKLLLLIKYIC